MNTKTKKTYAVLNTALSSDNLGDQIIVESLKFLLDNAKYQIPSHEYLSEESKKQIKDVDYVFLLGTNAIARDMTKSPWHLKSEDLNSNVFDNKLILVACGWCYYSDKEMTTETKDFFIRSLSKDVYHSVRDSYTLKQLNSIGINNVLNTNCSTLWHPHIEADKMIIATQKTNNVIFTITDYRQDTKLDLGFIRTLLIWHENVFFWPQGTHDLEYYYDKLFDSRIQILNHSLDAFDKCIETHGYDMSYIGTRLHAGIRAHWYGIPSLIISIDNRANEINNDTNLPIIQRDKLLSESLCSLFATSMDSITKLNLNTVEVSKFKDYIQHIIS